MAPNPNMTAFIHDTQVSTMSELNESLLVTEKNPLIERKLTLKMMSRASSSQIIHQLLTGR